jgi:hypothetical protein
MEANWIWEMLKKVAKIFLLQSLSLYDPNAFEYGYGLPSNLMPRLLSYLSLHLPSLSPKIVDIFVIMGRMDPELLKISLPTIFCGLVDWILSPDTHKSTTSILLRIFALYLVSFPLFGEFWNDGMLMYTSKLLFLTILVDNMIPYLIKLFSDSFGVDCEPSSYFQKVPKVSQLPQTCLITLQVTDAIFKSLSHSSFPHVNSKAFPLMQINPALYSGLKQKIQVFLYLT